MLFCFYNVTILSEREIMTHLHYHIKHGPHSKNGGSQNQIARKTANYETESYKSFVKITDFT